MRKHIKMEIIKRLENEGMSWYEDWVAIIFLAAMCVAIWLLRLPDINWQIALSGWSAIDWVAHLNNPEAFRFDFPNGMHIYEKSSFMHVYPLAQKWLGIAPESLLPIVILFEICFMAACAVYFCRTLLPGSSLVACCIFALLVICSPARDMDLANFGAPFFWGLFYNIADGLKLLGIGLFFNQRVLLAALLFAASLTVHPLIAFSGCAFLFGYLIVGPRVFKPQRLLLAIGLFCTLSVFWVVLKFGNTSAGSGIVDAQTWVNMARTFSYHFFPVCSGNLTVEHDTRLLPLLSLLVLATFYLPKVCVDYRRCLGILAGALVLVLLVIVGLLISVYVPVPTLIKLSLPRASAMLILVALAISVVGLVTDVVTGRPLIRALSCAVLLSPFFLKPGFSLLPICLLILPRISKQLSKPIPALIRYAPLPLVLAILLLGLILWSMNIINNTHVAAYLGSVGIWRFIGGASLFFISLAVFNRFVSPSNMGQSLAGIILMSIALIFSIQWQQKQVPPDSHKKMGSDYLAAQLWAKANTDSKALFMVDPTIYYGWRDFSSRSSFGNLREWLHTSWLYDSSKDMYLEGMQRFNEFGIKIEPYVKEYSNIKFAGFSQLHNDVLKRFYSVESDWFVKMANLYHIDYLVLSKQHVRKEYPFERVFENEHYIIFGLHDRQDYVDFK